MISIHPPPARARALAPLAAVSAILAIGVLPVASSGSASISLVNDIVVIHKSASCAAPGALMRSPVTAPPDGDAVIPGRLIVRLRGSGRESPARPVGGGAGPARRDADGCLLTGIGAIDAMSHTLSLRAVTAPFHTRRPFALSDVRVLVYASSMAPADAAALLSKDAAVLWAEPDYLRRVDAFPTDASYPQQSTLPRINAERAWDLTTGDPSAVIAVIDTGLDRAHADLAPNVWANEAEMTGIAGVDDDGNGFVDDVTGWDFVDIDPFYATAGEDASTPDNDPQDFAGHGTGVAGIAAAAANNTSGALGFNIAGVCWSCRVMGLRAGFLGTSGVGFVLESAWTQALVYAADNGARVANLSFGGPGTSQIGAAAVAYALSRDLLIVASAGNSNNSAPSYPASFPGVVAVAATDFADKKANFSSFGSWVTLAAPGVNVLTTWVGGNYVNGSGTSFSAPHVAGAAGLLFSYLPAIGGAEAADLLTAGAIDVDALNPSYAGLLGAGRLDSYRALVGWRVGVTNSGGAPLNVTGVTIDPGAPWLSFSSTLPASVVPGGTIFLDPVVDADIAPCGASSATISVASDDPGHPSTPVEIHVSIDCDADNDGHDCPDRGGDDCDDGDPAEHPGAPEICEGSAACDGVSGRDENCDGRVDEICSCSGRPNGPETLPPVSISTPAKAAVRVTWVDLADNEKGFRIYRRHGGAKWKHVGDVGKDVQSFDDTHVLRGTHFTYAVGAFNAKGSSPRVESFYSVIP